MTAGRAGLMPFAKSGDQWPATSDGRLNTGQ
jgi:hypothetical protein